MWYEEKRKSSWPWSTNEYGADLSNGGGSGEGSNMRVISQYQIERHIFKILNETAGIRALSKYNGIWNQALFRMSSSMPGVKGSQLAQSRDL